MGTPKKAPSYRKTLRTLIFPGEKAGLKSLTPGAAAEELHAKEKQETLDSPINFKTFAWVR